MTLHTHTLVKFERCRILEYTKKEEQTPSNSKSVDSFMSEIKSAFIIFEDALKSIDFSTLIGLRAFKSIFTYVLSFSFEILSNNSCKKV